MYTMSKHFINIKELAKSLMHEFAKTKLVSKGE